jgi:hypothetical protein
MAVPPAKGLDEACAWLRKAALTPFPWERSPDEYGAGDKSGNARDCIVA